MSVTTRDERGRFVPGASGNPAGRGPGRPAQELNEQADRVAGLVLDECERILTDAAASKEDRRHALRAAIAMVARRATARSESDLSVTAEAELEALLQKAPPEVVAWLAQAEVG